MKQVKIDEDIFIDICIYLLKKKDTETNMLLKKLKPKIEAYIKRYIYNEWIRPP